MDPLLASASCYWEGNTTEGSLASWRSLSKSHSQAGQLSIPPLNPKTTKPGSQTVVPLHQALPGTEASSLR